VSRANLRPCLSCGHVEIAKGFAVTELRPALKLYRAAYPAHRDRS
jgi:hypothetical protein